MNRSFLHHAFTARVPSLLAALALALALSAAPAFAQADDLYARAESLAAVGQYLDAAAVYARFAAGLRPNQAPWRLAAMTGRAWALAEAGFRDSAVPLIVRLNAIAEDSPELASRLPASVEEDYLLRKAALERMVGLPARPTLERYRLRYPQGKGIAGVYRDLAREAAGMDEWREFLRSCVRLGGRDARIATWRLELAEGELTLGDTRAAIRLWKTVIVRHTRTPAAMEAVERLVAITGRLPIGDPVFVADLAELVSSRRSEFAARGSLAGAEALLARTRALMEGADPDLAPVASVPRGTPAANPDPAPSPHSAAPTTPVGAPTTVGTASPAPASSEPSPASHSAQTGSSTPPAGSPAGAVVPASGSRLPEPTAPPPVAVKRLLTAPLPVRAGLEDYLKPLVFRLRGVAEERGLRIIPERWYYRYASGARDLTDAVVGLDIARSEEGMILTVSIIYPAANVTDVFTIPWRERPLDEDYTSTARDIIKLVLRD